MTVPALRILLTADMLITFLPGWTVRDGSGSWQRWFRAEWFLAVAALREGRDQAAGPATAAWPAGGGLADQRHRYGGEADRGQAPGAAVQQVLRYADGEYDVADLRYRDRQPGPGRHDPAAPQGDAEQDQADDVARDEEVRAQADRAERADAGQQGAGGPGAMPILAAPSATVSGPAMLGEHRNIRPAKDSTSPAVPSRGAPRRASIPAVITAGIRVRATITVSQRTAARRPGARPPWRPGRCSSRWCSTAGCRAGSRRRAARPAAGRPALPASPAAWAGSGAWVRGGSHVGSLRPGGAGPARR